MIKLIKDRTIDILREHIVDFRYFVRTYDGVTELYIRIKYNGRTCEYLCYREFSDGIPDFSTYKYGIHDTFASIFGNDANITILDEVFFNVTGKVNKDFS